MIFKLIVFESLKCQFICFHEKWKEKVKKRKNHMESVFRLDIHFLLVQHVMDQV